jgi:hypothetical protein
MGTATMGRKKKVDPPAAKRTTAFAIKGSTEWADFVSRGAKHCRTDVSKLFDAAVIEYLKARGFDEEPPQR